MMKINLIIILSLMALATSSWADDDSLFGKRCKGCTIPAHSHPQYEETGHNHMGIKPTIIPAKKPTGYPHCRVNVWGHTPRKGRCVWRDEVAVGFENGWTICGKLQVQCDSDWLFRPWFGRKNSKDKKMTN